MCQSWFDYDYEGYDDTLYREMTLSALRVLDIKRQHLANRLKPLSCRINHPTSPPISTNYIRANQSQGDAPRHTFWRSYEV